MSLTSGQYDHLPPGDGRHESWPFPSRSRPGVSLCRHSHAPAPARRNRLGREAAETPTTDVGRRGRHVKRAYSRSSAEPRFSAPPEPHVGSSGGQEAFAAGHARQFARTRTSRNELLGQRRGHDPSTGNCCRAANSAICDTRRPENVTFESSLAPPYYRKESPRASHSFRSARRPRSHLALKLSQKIGPGSSSAQLQTIVVLRVRQ